MYQVTIPLKMLLLHNPIHQNLYHVTSITQTEHHYMNSDIGNRLSIVITVNATFDRSYI